MVLRRGWWEGGGAEKGVVLRRGGAEKGVVLRRGGGC